MPYSMASKKYKNLKLQCERTCCMLIKWTVWLILAAFFFQVVFQENFVVWGTVCTNLWDSICWQSVIPPASLPPFFLFPEQATELHAANVLKKTSLIRKYWAQFKAIAQSGVVWWHLQTMEEIGFAVKHPPRTSILAYRTVQQLGAVQSRLSWLEGDTWSPAVPVNESQVWGGMLARKSSLTETHSGIQK